VKPWNLEERGGGLTGAAVVAVSEVSIEAAMDLRLCLEGSVLAALSVVLVPSEEGFSPFEITCFTDSRSSGLFLPSLSGSLGFDTCWVGSVVSD
jgi:hypothetical protein